MFTSNQNNNVSQFKIVLLGDAGAGKTVYINKLITNHFEQRYLATLGVEVTSLTLNTNKGQVEFSIYETAGQEKFGGLRDSYYEGANLAIIFFDLTSRITFKNVDYWVRDLRRTCENDIPIILIGNKCDILPRKVQLQTITEFTNRIDNQNILYFDISVKSNYNIDQPLLHAAKLLLNDNDAIFAEVATIQTNL